MIDAMKQALETLAKLPADAWISPEAGIRNYEAMSILRQAIAEAEKQEPVSAKAIFETIIQWDEGAGKRSRIDLAQRIFDLYAPPKREWVGLTDDEVVACWARPDIFSIAHAIEAKLKEKNNG